MFYLRLSVALALLWGTSQALASNPPVAIDGLSPAVEVVMSAARSSEVAEEIVSRMGKNGWSSDESSAEFVRLSHAQPVSPEVVTAFCEGDSPCKLTRKLTFQFSQEETDVRVLAWTQMEIITKRYGKKTIDIAAMDARSLAAGLNQLQKYFVARRNPNDVSVAARLASLPKEASKERIIALLGVPVSEGTPREGQTMLIYKDLPNTTKADSIRNQQGDQCVVILTNQHLENFTCLSDVFKQ